MIEAKNRYKLMKFKFCRSIYPVWYLFFQILFIALFPSKIIFAQDSNKKGFSLSDAVSLTIRNQPNIYLMEKKLEIKKGALQDAKGGFDPKLNLLTEYKQEETHLSRLEYYPASGIEDSKIETITYGVNLEKLTRFGITITPQVRIVRTDYKVYPFYDTLYGQYRKVDPIGKASVDLYINVPLLKGWGIDATTANERGAKKECEVGFFELQHSISESILNVEKAYWEYLAVKKQLDQKRISESWSQLLVKDINVYIKTNVRPAADIEQILANLADKTAMRIAGEQYLFATRQQLGLVMGVAFDEIRDIPFPSDEFPDIGDDEINEISKSTAEIITGSLNRRADYRAIKAKQDLGKILLEDAKNKMLPQFDLNLRVGYYGLDEGKDTSTFYTPLKENIPGFNCSFSLKYKFPLPNNSAKGILKQKKSAYEHTIISGNNLARTIRSNIHVNIRGLMNNLHELGKAREAVQAYRRVVANEKQKFRLGKSSLQDYILMEDYLSNALQKEIAAHYKLSKTLAQLHFETGCYLIESRRNSFSSRFLKN